MSNVLHRRVFVLNRNWQLIDEKSVTDAILQMASDAATAIDVQPDGNLVPTKWDDWVNLAPLHEDEVIHTQHRLIRMPTVIISVNYAGLSKRKPKFNLKNIAKRDGFVDQYTKEVLTDPKTWSMDHVVPLSRGGSDTPDNVVLSHKKFNNKKGSKLPEEMGLVRPKIRKLGVALPEPSHPHHEMFTMK